MISRYGISVVIKFFLVAAIILIYDFLLIDGDIIRYTIIVVVCIFSFLVLIFFRDPERALPNDQDVIISPADGKVVLIKELVEVEYLRQDAIQVSIFMSPLNVHVNRFPISGKVEYFKHIPGKYIVAFDEKSSDLNERTHIGINDNGYKVFFKQIAGTVARRIIADLHIGKDAKRGERFGMIRFGSRVDVIMPKNTELSVSLNDRVLAGESILAHYPKTIQGIP